MNARPGDCAVQPVSSAESVWLVLVEASVRGGGGGGCAVLWKVRDECLPDSLGGGLSGLSVELEGGGGGGCCLG